MKRILIGLLSALALATPAAASPQEAPAIATVQRFFDAMAALNDEGTINDCHESGNETHPRHGRMLAEKATQ